MYDTSFQGTESQITKNSDLHESGNKWSEPYNCSSLLLWELPGRGAGKGNSRATLQILWTEKIMLSLRKSRWLEFTGQSTIWKGVTQERSNENCTNSPKPSRLHRFLLLLHFPWYSFHLFNIYVFVSVIWSIQVKYQVLLSQRWHMARCKQEVSDEYISQAGEAELGRKWLANGSSEWIANIGS